SSRACKPLTPAGAQRACTSLPSSTTTVTPAQSSAAAGACNRTGATSTGTAASTSLLIHPCPWRAAGLRRLIMWGQSCGVYSCARAAPQHYRYRAEHDEHQHADAQPGDRRQARRRFGIVVVAGKMGEPQEALCRRAAPLG